MGLKKEQNAKDCTIHVFNDAQTNFVYISDKLKEFYPNTYHRLTQLFVKMEIEWGEVKGTKDIWIRDYMPIQISEDHFLMYNYSPDYLTGHDINSRTASYSIFHRYIPDCCCKDIKIKLDGGNVVPYHNGMILTDKVFTENGYEKNDQTFYRYLKEKISANIILLPWHCDNPDDPNADVYGHADGLVRWTGNGKILLTNHRDFDAKEADEIRKRLEMENLEVTEMFFDVPNPNRDFNWAYINYLQVGNKIIVPVFGIPEDKQALAYIKEANPDCIIRTFRMRHIASLGGVLHCITWNIKKPI